MPDHPHGCGEKLGTFFGLPFRSGSSPRVWGKAFVRSDTLCNLRIIPTGVGKRALFSLYNKLTTDHPHGCGEKYTFGNLPI